MALSTREPRPISIPSGQAPAPPDRKPAQASRPDTRSKKTEIPQPVDRIHKRRLDTTLGPASPWPLGDKKGMHCWEA